MGLLLGFVCLKPSPLGRHPKWWMKAAWAKRLTRADLMFRAYWVMPSGPFKAEASFGTFKASEVSRTPAKVASVSILCSHCACVKVHIQVLVNLRVC